MRAVHLVPLLLPLLLSPARGAGPLPGANAAALIEAGRRIYDEGVLPSGAPLRAVRPGGVKVVGADGACALCHQYSGMGLTEGSVPVPPVTGKALFDKLTLASYGRSPRRARGMVFKDFHFKTRPPYSDASLAEALRRGVSPTGHVFQYMMPRYELADGDMSALIAYLRTLSSHPSPGADVRELHIATAIAPGVNASRRKAFLAVLEACFDEKQPRPETGGTVRQSWHLHVWQLDGAPSTWTGQLQARYAERPVFAMVSGLGDAEWGPVEDFCEASRLPCLFPNTDVPGSPSGGRYSFYFYRGTLLEADVMASHVAERRYSLGLRRVIQISRRDDAGARGAATLAATLAAAAGGPLAVEHRVLDEMPHPGARLLDDIGPEDALVLWLREADLARLGKDAGTAPAAGLVIASGLLGGLENMPLPPDWRKGLLMTYPFDPPERWNRRMDFNLRTWLAERNIESQDERMQGNTLAACNLLTEGMLRLRGQYLRDYLVEWTENYPTQMGNAPAPQAFPRFSLGPGQRFSSKGAYIARFAAPEFQRLERVEDWVVP